MMYHIIVNPASKSGRGQKIWKTIEPVLLKRSISYQVYFSKKSGDVAAETKRLSALNEPIFLIILGGDGTMNEALQGMHPISNFTVGYIPTGSSNDLARNLGIPRDPLLALEKILDGEALSLLDIGLLQYENVPPKAARLEELGTSRQRKFLVSCGIGFDAAVCSEAMSSPIKYALNRLGLGKLTYLGIALKQLITASRPSCELWLDHNEEPIRLKKFLFAASMNHRFEGGGFMFCPNADYQDDEYKARPAPRMESLLLSDVFNGKVFAAFVTEYRFVLGTVVFKRAPDILHKRDEKNISDEYCNFYYPFDQVSENPEICREKLFEQLCDQ